MPSCPGQLRCIVLCLVIMLNLTCEFRSALRIPVRLISRRTSNTIATGEGLVASKTPEIDDQYSYHLPVMKDECCDYLNIRPGGIYVDCTLGGGGHTKAILDRGGHVIGFDQDPDAIKRSQTILQSYITTGACEIIQSNFRNIREAVAASRLAGPGSGRNGLVDGVLMDLGVSSFQINEGSRGFAFGQNGPLDMRMNKGELGTYASGTVDTRLSAHDIINMWDASAIADVLYHYGDETRSRSIAQKIVEMRPLNTTAQLVDAIASKISFQQRSKTLARCFQALRIVVNDEIGALEDALKNMHLCVRYGGRFVVMSYHSLEDRRVKNLMRTGNLHGTDDTDEPEHTTPHSRNKFKEVPILSSQKATTQVNPWRAVTKRAITPNEEELAVNRRARSAKLRVADQNMPHPGEDNIALVDNVSGQSVKKLKKEPELYQTAKQLAKQKRRESQRINANPDQVEE